MNIPQPSPPRSKSGYSLVEVTLALLVVAIGLTATFSLFPEAMKNTRAAVDDAEIALFADYVFNTLAVGAAVDGVNFHIQDVNDYASLVLSDKPQNQSKRELSTGSLSQFYWIANDDDMGTAGDHPESNPDAWHLAEDAGYWSTAFSYRLTYGKRSKGNNRDTIYATLEVWPGEWKSIADEKTFKPYVFYREILPYPNL